MQDLWNTIKNHVTYRRHEGEVQARDRKHNKNRKFPKFQKELVMQAQEVFRTSNRQSHIIVKILNIQNMEKHIESYKRGASHLKIDSSE
jgi:hypothetical protein